MSTPRTPTTHLRRRLTWTSGTVDLILGQAERIGRNMADLLPGVGSGGGEGGSRAPHEVDPTGDAVAAQVRADAWEAEQLAERMATDAAALLKIFQRYDRAPGDQDDATRRTLEELNRPKCQVHLRCGFLTDAYRKAPTRVRYRNQPTLDAELWLCEWCEKRVRAAAATGARGPLAIPAANEVKYHARKTGLHPSDHVVAEAGDARDVEEYTGIRHSVG